MLPFCLTWLLFDFDTWQPSEITVDILWPCLLITSTSVRLSFLRIVNLISCSFQFLSLIWYIVLKTFDQSTHLSNISSLCFENNAKLVLKSFCRKRLWKVNIVSILCCCTVWKLCTMHNFDCTSVCKAFKMFTCFCSKRRFEQNTTSPEWKGANDDWLTFFDSWLSYLNFG